MSSWKLSFVTSMMFGESAMVVSFRRSWLAAKEMRPRASNAIRPGGVVLSRCRKIGSRLPSMWFEQSSQLDCMCGAAIVRGR